MKRAAVGILVRTASTSASAATFEAPSAAASTSASASAAPRRGRPPGSLNKKKNGTFTTFLGNTVQKKAPKALVIEKAPQTRSKSNKQ